MGTHGGNKEDGSMTDSERQKIMHDLKYLISVSKSEAKERFKKQLEEIKKSR